MPFTEDEIRAWHEARRRLEHRPQPIWRPEARAICINCHNPFGFNEGVITDDVALCDICAGD